MTKIIHVKDLKKHFKTVKRGHGFIAAFKSFIKPEVEYKQALKGISFDIKEGEIVGLIGPNGAGKSTALKVLCGLLWPDSGEAVVMGMLPWKEQGKACEKHRRSIWAKDKPLLGSAAC